MGRIGIRSPRDERELAQLWQLNHAVFADELRQHSRHDDGLLVDKFHAKNHYLAAWDGETAVGMISAHREAPFSAVERFGETMERHIIAGRTAEIRLFALRPDYRRTTVAYRLGGTLFHMLGSDGIERMIISGISSQKQFYEHIGFVAVGPGIQDGDACFFPMVAELPAVLRRYTAAITRGTK